MANCEKRPKQERDDIHVRFTHIAIPTSFCILVFCNVGGVEVCIMAGVHWMCYMYVLAGVRNMMSATFL